MNHLTLSITLLAVTGAAPALADPTHPPHAATVSAEGANDQRRQPAAESAHDRRGVTASEGANDRRGSVAPEGANDMHAARPAGAARQASTQPGH